MILIGLCFSRSSANWQDRPWYREVVFSSFSAGR